MTLPRFTTNPKKNPRKGTTMSNPFGPDSDRQAAARESQLAFGKAHKAKEHPTQADLTSALAARFNPPPLPDEAVAAALPEGQWLPRAVAGQRLARAAGVGLDDTTTGQALLIDLIRRGIVDPRDEADGVRLVPVAERPGSAAAEARRKHLAQLQADLADLEASS
jgi:hypothetical protein